LLRELTALHRPPSFRLRGGEKEGGGKGRKTGREAEGRGEEMKGRRGEGICRTNVKLLSIYTRL